MFKAKGSKDIFLREQNFENSSLGDMEFLEKDHLYLDQTFIQSTKELI